MGCLLGKELDEGTNQKKIIGSIDVLLYLATLC